MVNTPSHIADVNISWLFFVGWSTAKGTPRFFLNRLLTPTFFVFYLFRDVLRSMVVTLR
jgi:hypothetical protein